ncbi:MAG: hypothetical protein ABSH56_06920 [Bryobacteraceae bacterium]|jgi:hypothetical protein
MERALEERLDGMGALLPQDSVTDYRLQWERIQTRFVDEPRTAVQQADELVNETSTRLSEGFASARRQLEDQWSSGDNVSTEDLRVALKKYRTFFEKLLTL